MSSSNPTRGIRLPLSFRERSHLLSTHLLQGWAFFVPGTRQFHGQREGFATFLRVLLYADYARQGRLTVSVVSRDKKEVKTMQNDLRWAEWEMDHRVTGARDERQRDRLAGLCSEVEEAQSASRRKGGDKRAELAGLVNQLRVAASQVLKPLWDSSLR
jgi:hypothetical protein